MKVKICCNANFRMMEEKEQSRLLIVEDPFVDIFRTYLYFVCSVIIVVLCLANFDQNPVVVTIVSLFFLLLMCVSGYRRLKVSSEDVVVEYVKVLPFMSIRRCYRFDDIDSIVFKLPVSARGFAIEVIFNWIFPAGSVWNNVRINFRDGTNREINTKISREKLLQFKDVIRRFAPDKVGEL